MNPKRSRELLSSDDESASKRASQPLGQEKRPEFETWGGFFKNLSLWTIVCEQLGTS